MKLRARVRGFQFFLWMCAVASAVGCTSEPLATPMASSEVPEFAIAGIHLEQNHTDQDTEVVIVVKAHDEGLASLRVLDPAGQVILAQSAHSSTLGVREFAVESPEPGLRQVIAAYPAGKYVIEGVTMSGARLRSVASLSHDLPRPATLTLSPALDTVTWSGVSGAAKYVLEIEREVEGADEMKLTLEVPPGTRSFQVPQSMRVSGDYQVGVAVILGNGNTTVAEKSFTLE